MAGIQMLLAGGNAVDAAVAVAATLNVVEPFMSGVGGIGLMLISRGSERHVLDFIGRAPRAADPARCTDDELAGGPKSCATPGNLGGWLAALERFGSMDRARVLGPAIALAEQGVPLTWKNVDFYEAARATLGRSQEARRLYLGNGGPRPGAVVTYKELAATLRQVAEGGSDVFYRGPIAKAIARAVRETGGWLDEADLAALAPEWREPATIAYREHRVSSVPPPFSAFQMLETLSVLEGHPAQFLNEHTTHFACADASATVVTVTQTLGVPFGSGFAVPGTGIVMNNILKWMDRDPESPNVLRAGRRAGTMMSPTQVFRDGAFVMSIGTPGSYGILQTTPQMLLNVLEFGMNVQEAIEAPRVRVYGDRLVDAEARIAADTRAALGGRGHQVNVIDEWSWIVGGGQGIVRDRESGALMAGAAPRPDGVPLQSVDPSLALPLSCNGSARCQASLHTEKIKAGMRKIPLRLARFSPT